MTKPKPLYWTNEMRTLRQLVPHADNPRHITDEAGERLKHSLRKFEQPLPILIDAAGNLHDGHQRLDKWAEEFSLDLEVAVRVSSRPLSDIERKELIVLLHKGATGEFDFDLLGGWAEPEELVEWGFTVEELGRLLKEESFLGVEPDAKLNPRQLPIDVIYTLQMADCTCCLAVQAGLKYGIQSAQYRLCPYVGQLGGRHKVEFVDNDYFNYDHAVHLKAVQELQPRYATVMDIMTKKQCAKDSVTWYSFEQVLGWAEELEQHAENVIVIPKYDCLDKIPEKYILGYSVPTSHGGTPLPVEMFKGRRVHLLGGSWKAQLAHMAQLGDDVVSLDNNYVQRQASVLGVACSPDGDEFQMQDVGYDYLTNVRYAALALSFGAIGAKVNELYSK